MTTLVLIVQSLALIAAVALFIVLGQPRRVALAALFVLIGIATVGSALADVTTTVNLGPLWDAMVPIIASAGGVLITAAVGWAVAIFRRWTGIQVEANDRDALHSACVTGLNFALAAAGKLAHDLTVDEKSAALASATGYVIQSVPDALERLGVTPDSVKVIVASKLGAAAQSSLAAVTTATPAVNVVVPAAPAQAL